MANCCAPTTSAQSWIDWQQYDGRTKYRIRDEVERLALVGQEFVLSNTDRSSHSRENIHFLTSMNDINGLGGGNAATFDEREFVLGEQSQVAPALVTFAGIAYLAWAGTDRNHTLNFMPVPQIYAPPASGGGNIT